MTVVVSNKSLINVIVLPYRNTWRTAMRRERLDNLEIRVAHLERKEMNFDEPNHHGRKSWADIDDLKKAHFRKFKKGLTRFLVTLDDIAEGEQAIEDLGLGDGFLSRVERNSERYYKKAIQSILDSTGLPKEEATIEGFLRGHQNVRIRLNYPEASIRGIVAFAFKEIFKRNYYIPDYNKEAIFEIASDLLGFEVRP